MGKRKIIRVAGKEIEVPTAETTGKEIKKIADIPNNRQLVKEDRNGSVRVGDNEKGRVSPDTVFQDIPTLKSG